MKREAVKMCPIRPAPQTIVSCRDKEGRNNALVVGFVANASINPAMVLIGIVPERFSYHMIKETGEFVVNIPARGFEKEFSYLGSKSGRDGDKFKALNLQWEEGTKVKAPLLSDTGEYICTKKTGRKGRTERVTVRPFRCVPSTALILLVRVWSLGYLPPSVVKHQFVSVMVWMKEVV